MGLRELLFGDSEQVRLERDPSDCDDRIVGDLLQRGRNSCLSGGVGAGLLVISADNEATPREKIKARKLLRESAGVGTRPTNHDWGC